MKIIVTAPPKTGKSTLIRHVVTSLKTSGVLNCQGVLSEEKLDSTGTHRVGFTALLSNGTEALFMTKESCNTSQPPETAADKVLVGPYVVHLNVIDKFVVPILNTSYVEGTAEKNLIYIDEIGRAQAFSGAFLTVAEDIIRYSEQCVLASIVYEDEVWSQAFKAYDCVWLVEVTLDNRSFLPRILEAMYTYHHYYKLLPESKQKLLKAIFFELLHLKMYYSAKKLFSNAIKYILEGKIKFVTAVRNEDREGCVQHFEVIGETSRHDVKEWTGGRGREEGGDLVLTSGLSRTTAAAVSSTSTTTAVTMALSPHPASSNASSSPLSPPLASLCTTSALSPSVLSEASTSLLHGMERFSCDCPLFNGIAPFDGQQQECSHILAIVIQSSGDDA